MCIIYFDIVLEVIFGETSYSHYLYCSTIVLLKNILKSIQIREPPYGVWKKKKKLFRQKYCDKIKEFPKYYDTARVDSQLEYLV